MRGPRKYHGRLDIRCRAAAIASGPYSFIELSLNPAILKGLSLAFIQNPRTFNAMFLRFFGVSR